MQKVKSTAGLIELAFVIKFLSVADIGFSPDSTPQLLDFTTAMVLWAALAFVTGLYLLGVFQFSEDTPVNGVSPVGGLCGIGSLGLALLICVGLFSAIPPDNWVWNRLVGFAPPRFESAFADTGHGRRSRVDDQFAELQAGKYSLSHDGLAWSLELDDALQLAQANDRPLFIDFTGVNCLNCRDMETSVLNRPDIVSILATLPRAQLFLDEVPRVRDANEEERLLDTNQQHSKRLTGGLAMPSYVILSPDGKTVMSMVSGLVSRDRFHQFLEDGLAKFDHSRTTGDVEVSQRVPLAR